MQQIHELNARIALEEKRWPVAAAELAKANQQDARVQYLLGLALQQKGDAKAGKTALTRAAEPGGQLRLRPPEGQGRPGPRLEHRTV